MNTTVLAPGEPPAEESNNDRKDYCKNCACALDYQRDEPVCSTCSQLVTCFAVCPDRSLRVCCNILGRGDGHETRVTGFDKCEACYVRLTRVVSKLLVVSSREPPLEESTIDHERHCIRCHALDGVLDDGICATCTQDATRFAVCHCRSLHIYWKIVCRGDSTLVGSLGLTSAERVVCASRRPATTKS